MVVLTLAFLLAGCTTTEEENTSEEAQAANDQNENGSQEEPTEQNAQTENETNESSSPSSEESDEESENEEEAKYKVNQSDWSIERKDGQETKQKEVMLTFDDMPEGNTIEIAETLKEQDVSAVFFVNGTYLDDAEGRETLKKVADMGFEIGNHTTNHASLPTLTEEQQREEIEGTEERIHDITGEHSTFFRAPYGENTEFSDQYAAEHGMTKMNWTFGYDAKEEYQNADLLTDITLNTELLSDGANILMHDRPWTREALPDIIGGLEDKGYSFIDPEEIEEKT